MKVALKMLRVTMNIEEGKLVAWRVQPGRALGKVIFSTMSRPRKPLVSK